MNTFRKISATEFSYLGRDNADESPFVNQFFVEGKGYISLESMREAVRLAARENPGISLLLKGRWAWRYWQENPEPPTVDEYHGDWQALDSKDSAVINEALDARKDILSSVTLFTNIHPQKIHADTEDEINFKVLFRIHHALCDGMGTLHWMREVFRALRGESLQGSLSTLSELDIIAREDYPAAENLLTESKGVFPLSSKPDARACHWVKCRWPVSDRKIVAKIIFILKSLAEEQHGPCKTTFRIPSDLRRYLSKEEKQQEQFSNLSGVFDLRLQEDISVDAIQSLIVKALRNKADLSVYPKKLTPLTRFLPKSVFQPNRRFLQNMHEQGLCNITGMISYPGKIDLEAFSTKEFQALGIYGLPIPLEDKSIFVGMFSDQYGIQATLTVPNALSTIEQTRELGKTIEQRLMDL